MRLLVDANVLLDVALAREPWVHEGAALLDAIAGGRASGFVAGHTLPVVHYLCVRARGRTAAASAISDLLRIVDVVPLEKADVQQALALGLHDFEDALQAVSALRAEADAIVTRDAAGYTGFPVPTLLPGMALARLG